MSCEAQPHGSMIDGTNHLLFASTVLHISWFVELMICKAIRRSSNVSQTVNLHFDSTRLCRVAWHADHPPFH